MQTYALEEFPFPCYDTHNLKFLGAGSYGKVYKSVNLTTGEPVAIKQMDMPKILAQDLLPALQREIGLMKQINGNHVVKLLDSNIGKKYAYLILELCDSDLRKRMNQAPRLRMKEEVCIPIFVDIMNGFKSMAESSCIHRDIKPENILLKNGVAKIADFGFARKADLIFQSKYNEICGTPIYMSPQLIRGENYTSKSDIWSLGIMLYEMICGASPWPFKSFEAYKQALIKRPLAFPFDVKMGVDTKDFIKRSLVIEEDKRMSWGDVFKHPLIKDKIGGEPCLTLAVEPKVRLILAKIQTQAEKKDVNQKLIFNKFSQFQALDQNQFSALLRELSPTVTSFEIMLLFQLNDKNNDGKIDRNQFEGLLCEVNYRSEPAIAREIDEFIGFIKAKGYNVDLLFEKYDKNKTKALDTNQFKNLVDEIAPRYGYRERRLIIDYLDKNKSGMIQKNEFLEAFGGVSKSSETLKKEKALRNIEMLKLFLKDKHIPVQDLLKVGDISKDRMLNPGEFVKVMDKIGFVISAEEINDIFKQVDRNNSGRLDIQELSSLK